MILSNLWKIVTDCWIKIPHHFKHIELDEFVIMPDNVHGILTFKENYTSDQFCSKYGKLQKGSIPVIINQFKSSVTRILNKSTVEPRHGVADLYNNVADSQKNTHNLWNNKPDPQNNKFKRQPRYHERIIRDKSELSRIKKYIRDNPKNREKN